MRRRTTRLLVVVAVVGGGLGGFLLVRDDGEAPRRLPLSPTTTRPDLSHVELEGVTGTTTSTTLPLGEGRVSFRGRVRTPDGEVVPGATVRAEWGVPADPPVAVEVLADGKGRYELRGLYGGRWRIRAWRTPDFASGRVALLFVSENEERRLDLEVRRVAPYSVTFAIEPDPPIAFQNATLVVVIVERTVDEEGRTVTTPFAHQPVTLVTFGAWEVIDGEATRLTGGDGRVQWIVRCGAEGRQALGVQTAVRFNGLGVARCIPVSATTTTTTAPPPDEDGGERG